MSGGYAFSKNARVTCSEARKGKHIVYETDQMDIIGQITTENGKFRVIDMEHHDVLVSGTESLANLLDLFCEWGWLWMICGGTTRVTSGIRGISTMILPSTQRATVQRPKSCGLTWST
jgi:hypothetical protein